MKKKTFILFLLFCFSVAFAETGYAGIQWGTKWESLPFTKEDLTTKSMDRKLVGEDTTMYYHFRNLKLAGISYSLPREKTDLAKANYEHLVETLHADNITVKEFVNILEEQNEIDSKATSNEIDRVANKFIFNITKGIEAEGSQGFEKGNASIYIYDYNNDTRVYIFENIIENITFVVYLPHEQDY